MLALDFRRTLALAASAGLALALAGCPKKSEEPPAAAPAAPATTSGGEEKAESAAPGGAADKAPAGGETAAKAQPGEKTAAGTGKAAEAAPATLENKGKVRTIDVEEGKIEVVDVGGAALTFTLAEGATVLRLGKEAKLPEFQPGDAVKFTMTAEDPGVLSRLEAVEAAPSADAP